MLKANHISTGYGKKQVLFDVSLEVKQGEIILLIGSNGSGKSTLLKLIYGLLPLWSTEKVIIDKQGGIFFDNEDITGMTTSSLLQKGLLYIPQKNNCFDDLTVKENLDISGISLHNSNLYSNRFQEMLQLFPTLKKLLKQKPMKLSGGEKQLLALAMAFIHKPKMIMIDEPFAGLSPNNIELVRNQIVNLNKNHRITFLIVEHRVKESYAIAQEIFSLKLGRIFSTMKVDSNFSLNKLDTVFV